MSTHARSIEIQGLINGNHHLVVDESLPIDGPRRVRVIVFYDEEEVPHQQWMKTASRGGAFDFLSDPEEDIYDENDGEPFHE